MLRTLIRANSSHFLKNWLTDQRNKEENELKKLVTACIAVALICAMVVPAYAQSIGSYYREIVGAGSYTYYTYHTKVRHDNQAVNNTLHTAGGQVKFTSDGAAASMMAAVMRNNAVIGGYRTYDNSRVFITLAGGSQSGGGYHFQIANPYYEPIYCAGTWSPDTY